MHKVLVYSHVYTRYARKVSIFICHICHLSLIKELRELRELRELKVLFGTNKPAV